MRKTFLLLMATMAAIAVVSCGESAGTAETNNADVNEATGSEIVSLKELEAGNSDESVLSEASGKISVPTNYEITRDVYALISDELHTSECDYSDFVIDERGNVVSAKVTGGNTHKMYYEYDEEDRLVKSTKEHQLYGIEEQNWKYDDEGRMIELRLVETKDGKSTEKITTYVYDENGNLTGGRRATNGEKIFDKVYESDDMGRVTKCTEKDNGEIQYIFTYTYTDGVYNPVHCKEEGSKVFETDYLYDDRGRLVKEDTTYSGGEKMYFTFTYESIGEITESPETTSVLIPGDKWEYFEDCSMLPIPTSCLNSVFPGKTNHQFFLPTYKGVFLSAWGQTKYEPQFLDSTHAFKELDRYTNILTDVLGMEVRSMGTIIRVSRDGKDVADLNIEIIDGKYTLTIIPA